MRNNVNHPLYETEGRLRRYVSNDEASDLVFRKTAEWRCGRCGKSSDRGQCFGGEEHKPTLYLIAPEQGDGNSPCSITKSDMEANVGIAGDFGQPSDDSRVAAAQDKIGAWLEIFDTKAPCVGWLTASQQDRSFQVASA